MSQKLILTNTHFVGTPHHATVTIDDNDDFSAPSTGKQRFRFCKGVSSYEQ